MKKFYLIFIMLSFIMTPAGFGYAQELVINGELELWDDPFNPTSWDKAESINQAASPVHTGSYSAQHMSSPDGTQDLQQNVSGIVGGANYTISYWYFDFDQAARTRIWAYWLDGTTTLPDHEDELRANVYSEDNMEWQNFSINLTAPAAADGFRFEVRVYGQDGNTGGVVYYDDFSLQGAGVSPEPTNYPTNTAAVANGISIDLSWTDAIGDQLPNGYLILAADYAKITPPEDGIPVADDLDFSDGMGALNVGYGEEMCTFPNLDGNTQYWFVFYPYTNGGADIDYKIDNSAPYVSAITADINVVMSQNFDAGFGTWETISIIGAQAWEIDDIHGVNGTPCAKMNGYDGSAQENQDWLVSPAMDLSTFATATLTYMTAMNWPGPELEVLISSDYDGGGDPTIAIWDNIGGTLSTGNYTWTESGNVDLSAFLSSSLYLAFKYTSNSSEASTWEVDDILIIAGGLSPEPDNYPTAFEATSLGTSIQLNWVDAIGDQLPAGYIVLGRSNDNITPPVDGTAIMDDPDLSDGSGALNIPFGTEVCAFANLGVNETYYFAIYPYTNAGTNIDYKNDASAPAASATTANVTEILYEGFEDGWGDWQRVNLIGAEEWEIGDLYPEFGLYYARMSGYDGESHDNEDWLISPPMNFNNYSAEVFSFQSAMNYTGFGPDILIANDYDGSDPYSANWETLECDLSPGGWEWTASGDIDVSGIDGEMVYVAFVYTSSNNESATWEFDEIKVTGVEEIGIEEENNFSAEVSVYPNPAKDRVYITSTEEVGVNLYTMNGIAIQEEIVVNGTASIDISQLSSGIYFIRLTDESKNNKIQKLVVE